MPTSVVVGSGPRIFLVSLPGGSLRGYARAPLAEGLPRGLTDALARLDARDRLVTTEPALAPEIARAASRPVADPTREEFRSARARVPVLDAAAERAYALAVARGRLEEALRAPPEVLITLAREEERVERALGREERAAESFVRIPDSPIEKYQRAWEGARGAFARHHRELRTTVESEAQTVLPNLSAVVGARVAARLLAAAGGLPALGRMRAPRLQLLGSRRRPSSDRGPRYGLLYRAERMDEVPLGRRGAYARSLAALAAIAARADAYTHADLAGGLIARRDRRISELRRRRR